MQSTQLIVERDSLIGGEVKFKMIHGLSTNEKEEEEEGWRKHEGEGECNEQSEIDGGWH